jgi:hypothetical protein
MAIEVVGSKLPSENGYGQNGYSGSSSTLPGERVRIENLGGKAVADVSVPDNITDNLQEKAGWETRPVKTEPYPTAFGHHQPASKIDFPQSNDRRKSSVPAKPGNLSRG